MAITEKNTTHLNQSLCHILLETGNLTSIWSAFTVFQLCLISDARLSPTNPLCNYMAGPGGRVSISLSPLLPDNSVQNSTEKILLHNIIIICLCICVSHEIVSFLRG